MAVINGSKDLAALSIAANRLIKRHAFGSGVMGYSPFPVVDGLGVMVIQRRLLKRLAALYGVGYYRSLSKDVLRTMAGGIATQAALPTAMKLIPGIGLLLGSAGMATIGSASTYAMGRVFMRHFEGGGTLENFDAEQSQSAFKEELENGMKLAKSHDKSVG